MLDAAASSVDNTLVENLEYDLLLGKPVQSLKSSSDADSSSSQEHVIESMYNSIKVRGGGS